jgi:hypothetical protein
LSRRDNHHPAATAKMAILIVAAFPSRLSRYTCRIAFGPEIAAANEPCLTISSMRDRNSKHSTSFIVVLDHARLRQLTRCRAGSKDSDPRGQFDCPVRPLPATGQSRPA